MPRDSSGNFTLDTSNPVVPGTVIETGWANPTLVDIANALTDSLSRSGNGGMLTALKFADGTRTNPGQAWTNEPTTGWYRAGTHDVRFAMTGADLLQVMSTGGVNYFNALNTMVKGTLPYNGTTLAAIQAGQADGNQYAARIYGDNALDRAPVLSLFRAGAHEYFMSGAAVGAGELWIGVTNGLADYHDATLRAAAQLLLTPTGLTSTVPITGPGAATIDMLIGMIAGFIGSPGGNWLPMTGQTIFEVPFPKLFAHLGKTGAGSLVLPNMQGMFLRGWDPGSIVDPDGTGRTLGYTVEKAAIADHRHTDPGHSHQLFADNSRAVTSLGSGDLGMPGGGGTNSQVYNPAANTNSANTGLTGPSSLDPAVLLRTKDPRPINLAVTWCIYADG